WVSVRPCTASVMLIASLALLWGPMSGRSDETSKAMKIKRILQLTHTDQLVKQMLDQMKAAPTKQISSMDLPPEARGSVNNTHDKTALIAERLSGDRAKPASVKLYADTFTEEELEGIVTFYDSRAGRAMLQKMPQLLQQSMAVGQELRGDVTPEIRR